MPENLERRGDKWYWRQVINGKLYRRSTGFSDLARARRFAAQREIEVREGKLGWLKADVPLFDDWAAQFLATYHAGRDTEALLLKGPRERWGTRRLTEFVRSDVEGYFRERGQDCRNGTLERERVLLKGLFRAAVADKLISDNPLQGIRVFKTTPRSRTMTRDEETAIRAELDGFWNRLLTVALGTGLRRGELLALRPVDLRDKGNWLVVRPESNKTRKARLVPVRDEVQQALHLQWVENAKVDAVPYFARHADVVTQRFRVVCRRLKIDPHITVHDLRRTFGSRCAEAGMYPKHLQMIMGHEKIETTMRYYVHLEQQSILDALRKATL